MALIRNATFSLTASTTVPTEGGAATTVVVQGLAKAWASIDADATGHPVLDAFNVSSTADISTGITKVTFANSFSNSNYAVSGAGQAQDEAGGILGLWGRSTTSSRQMTSTSFHTDNRISSGGFRDLLYFGLSVCGDLT
jgi:hypothetical protein